MVKRITYVDPMQAGKIGAVLYFVFGLIVAIPMLLFTAIAGPDSTAMGQQVQLPSLYFIVALPFMYAVMGFVVVPIMCALYNFVAARVGGIEIRLEDRPPGPELTARDTLQPK